MIKADTFTAPTDEMFEVMKQATRGDDVYGVRLWYSYQCYVSNAILQKKEDETTNEFQAFIAQLTVGIFSFLL